MFIRFAVVGGVGFIVDSISLVLLNQLFPLVLARGVAFWVAASSNWYLNRHFTFLNGATARPAVAQWGQFLFASCIGFVPNWGCYWWLVTNTEWAELHPVLAMVPGIGLGMCVNYALSKYWVFRPRSLGE